MQCACAICHLWPVWLYNISPVINGTFSGKTEHKMCFFLFSLQILSEKFLIVRRTERDIITNVYRSASCKVPVIIVRF
jgi:hypothetical protein